MCGSVRVFPLVFGDLPQANEQGEPRVQRMAMRTQQNGPTGPFCFDGCGGVQTAYLMRIKIHIEATVLLERSSIRHGWQACQSKVVVPFWQIH